MRNETLSDWARRERCIALHYAGPKETHVYGLMTILYDELGRGCTADEWLDGAHYATGKLPPNYPVPTKIAEVYTEPSEQVDIYTYTPGLIVIEDADERFDPQWTWDEVFGIWPTNSPNYR